MDLQTYKKLSILTEQQTGYGILLENDAGLISPNLEWNVGIIKEMKEHITDYSQPIYVYATLQKYDSENRNGRIYSEAILRREEQRYQKVISMNTSFHELDHPECIGNEAVILTEGGWKEFKDVVDDEVVYTLNRDTNAIELQKITKKIYEHYEGKMIKIIGRNVDLVVTHNHRFWFINKRTGSGKFYTALELLNGDVPTTEYFIPKLGSWAGNDDKKIVIKGVEKEIYENTSYSKDKAKLFMSDLEINSSDFFAFMGIYLSEGSCTGSRGSLRTQRKITITQKSGDNADKIRELLKRLPFEWTENYYAPTNKITFCSYDNRLFYYLKPLGNSHTKYIPEELKKATPHLLNELIEWFLIGDGRARKVKGYKAKELFSTSKRLIDDLHEILIKAGGAGNIHTESRDNDRYIKNIDGTQRLIKGENSKPMHFLHISITQGLWLDSRFISVSEIDYNGYIGCVTVPNETFYVRSNGKSLWTGNSSVVSLTKGSPHRIVEMFWKGNVLIGKLEILVSRGYREHGGLYCGGDMMAHYLSYGMTLGISSRGVGTLKTINGRKMVQPDFELICFDVVSSPSTLGSYIYKDLADFSKYDENPTSSTSSIIKPASIMQNSKDVRKDAMMNRLNQFLTK